MVDYEILFIFLSNIFQSPFMAISALVVAYYVWLAVIFAILNLFELGKDKEVVRIEKSDE